MPITTGFRRIHLCDMLRHIPSCMKFHSFGIELKKKERKKKKKNIWIALLILVWQTENNHSNLAVSVKNIGSNIDLKYELNHKEEGGENNERKVYNLEGREK